MSLNDQLVRRVVGQFHNPRGFAGHIAGWVMGHRHSNVTRNRWAVDLLEIQPGERVLELGCGPGVALAAIAERLDNGVAVGVDHSDVMIRAARRRNARAVSEGRVQLVHGSVEKVLSTAAIAGPFDAALAVNNMGMWQEPEQRLREVRELLLPQGRIAIVSQPRVPGATAETTRAAAAELEGALERSGYTEVSSTYLELEPPVVCVRASAS